MIFSANIFGKAWHLTSTEQCLLYMFQHNEGSVLSVEHIVKVIGCGSWYAGNAVGSLKQKLTCSLEPDVQGQIRTKYGKGYVYTRN